MLDKRDYQRKSSLNGHLEASKPVRILLVEDNDADVYLLTKALDNRNLHYELTRFPDGEQAVRALAHFAVPPDVILIDLNLPGRSGFEVLGHLRSMPQLLGVPVGIFTSSDRRKDHDRSLLFGADCFIPKPMNF